MVNIKSKCLIFCILMIVFSIILCGCTIDQYIEYNNSIQAKYGDAIVLKNNDLDAPSFAVEYKNINRVSCNLLLDTRIMGRHITGLYLPKGETLSIKIDQKQVENGYEIILKEGNSLRYVLLDEKVKTIESQDGASIEIKVNKTISSNPEFNISGVIVEPYYRYGLDVSKESLESDEGQFVYLDSTNVRIVFPIKYKSKISEIEKVMFWWQNAIALIDEVFNTSFFKKDYSAMTFEFIDDLPYFVCNVDENIIELNSNLLEEMIDYEKLSIDENDILFDVLKSVVRLKNMQTYCYEETFLKDYIEDIIASITFVNMVDSSAISENNSNYNIINNVNVLNTYKRIDSLDEKDNIINMFMLLYFEKGEKYLVDIIKNLSNTNKTYEDFLDENKLNENLDLVATKYTYGAFNQDSQSGIHVRLGETYIFDFNSNIISNEDGWSVDFLTGDIIMWSKVENGVYKYTPSTDILKDTFSITLKNGDKEKILYGNITVDIDVCEYKLYSDVNFKSLAEAIKDSKSMAPTKSQSLKKAEIEKEEEYSMTSRSFAKLSGCIQVDKTDFYKIYLASSGLCSVDFGVKEYHSEIFSNVLTVSEYTEELCYEIRLKEGYLYYFNIYNLADKGLGFAKLGIKSKDSDVIEDINEEYLISEPLNRKDVVKYESIDRKLDSIHMQDLICNSIEIAKIFDITQRPVTFKETIKLCNSNSIESVFVNLQSRSEIQYINIDVPAQMSGVTLNIRLASTDEILKTVTLKSGNNNINIDSIYAEKFRLEFTSPNSYALIINNIEFGHFINAMPIIPGTSKDIEYIGQWHTSHEYVSMNGSLAISNSKGAKASYKFNGDEISIYATKGKDFGTATIYIDEKAICAVDLNSKETQSSQLIYSTKLAAGDHVVTIEANGESSINIDYFSVHVLGKSVVKNNFSKIWFILFIPALVIVGAIISVSLDIISKKRKARAN